MTAHEAGDAFEPTLSERYRLGEIVGFGGAAIVHRAWDVRVGRVVAVKLYRAGAAESGCAPHRAEVAALTLLRHPGLVALYDAGIEAGRAYLVMQMIEGESLSQRLSRGPLPTAAVTAIGSALASTLACVHEHDIVHRDVKPANVLLDERDRPFLADFGVSRLIDATRSTATGLVLGTPAFLAPEQVRGHRVGPAADVYALGLVLLEALTGRREYPGGVVESAVARLHRAPELPVGMPDHLRTLLAAMTADDPAARPDAAEVAARLTGVSPSPVEAAPRGAADRAESRRRRRLVSALVAVATVATGAGMGGALLTATTPVTSVASPLRAPLPRPEPRPGPGATFVASTPPADGVPAPPTRTREAVEVPAYSSIDSDDRSEPSAGGPDPDDVADDTGRRNGTGKTKDKDKNKDKNNGNGNGKHRGKG
jgi:serine/threonine protein kinase